MSTKLYVGNIAYTVTEDELRTLFAPAGPVESVTIGLASPAGRARGFGWVEMESEEAASQAIALLHGLEHKGRRLNVKRPAPEASPWFRKAG